ncbi:phosphorylase family protein [Streptomyces yaizuensis]|uniref:1-hydroxy-2-methyl-2-butenyl 4-diphosphate reductase n=1 Tax=Streptomyces yaizuensis TaxID=2989713 RepID=A0ABQ5P782_9ACTN|nr:1-hydroxy-2-methyl-2-butenyl 4-diphosphate reductase [Streptomyces sp. YSPA8]GLF98443.1 1-hydroxy-2-methyl-2-butenyl 4-diphosphate reductase [Streptomyces sp. YSPA8]
MPTAPAGEPAPPPLPLPLLIACALGIEQLALRPARTGPGGHPGPVTLVRTGMGPDRAGRAVRGALATGPLRHAAVLASGFCAGLAPGMLPGDVVVADTVHDPAGAAPAGTSAGAPAGAPAGAFAEPGHCTGAALLAAAVARAVPGHRVHTGTLTGSDRIVGRRERERLRTTGAIAVDMESAAALRAALAAGPRPVAAVRVVVDAPGHELIRPATVRGGISAFRVLRAVLPAFHEWHRSLPLPRR